MHYSLALGIALLLVCGCISLLRPLAMRIKLVDLPNQRKLHQGQIPLVGGIGIFIGFTVSLLCLTKALFFYQGLLLAGGILVLVGILDDFRELSARPRFIAQIAVALLISVWGGNTLIDLGDLFNAGSVYLGPIFGVIFTVFAVVGMINAINMLDGVDGLSGSVVIFILVVLAFFAWHWALFYDGLAIGLLIMCVLGFLVFNFPYRNNLPYKVFMGDAGSMFLGLVIAWFAIHLSQSSLLASDSVYNHPMIILITLTIPVYDSLTVMVRRLCKRRSPFLSDRLHLHYLLADHGYSGREVVLVISLLTLATGGIAILADYNNVPAWILCCGWCLGCICYGLGLNHYSTQVTPIVNRP